MKAFGMVILSQFRSRTSKPESGFCISRTMILIGVRVVNRIGPFSSTVPVIQKS